MSAVHLSQHGPEPNQYRSGPLHRLPLNSGSEILYNPALKRVSVLPKRLIDRLSACQGFLTLSDHSANMISQFSPASNPADVEGWLAQMADAGLLLSFATLLKTCAATPAEADSATGRVKWLAVPTRSRCSDLLEAVSSYITNIRAHGHRIRLIVADQTPLEAGGEESRSGLRALARQNGIETFYAGLEEKRAFLDALCSDGSIPRGPVEFAVFGLPSASANIGANRNAILLHTLGELVISVDDDTRCEIARVPSSHPGVRFCGDLDPTEAWFFGNRAGARAFVEPADVDFIDSHAQMLGRPAGRILTDAVENGGVDLTSVCAHLLGQLCAGSGQILSTYSGLVGDAGVYSAYPFMVHPSSATRQRFTESQAMYARNIRSREIVRQALTPAIAHGPAAAGLATCVGLDNREILPPFFPPFRSEDGIFAQMLARCREGAFVGHVPFTILHDRPEGRTYGDVLTIRVSDCVSSALAGCSLTVAERSGPDRLSRFGRVMIALGDLAEDDFRDWAQTAALTRAAGLSQYTEAALRRDCCFPAYWAEGLSAVVERFSQAVLDPAYIIPEEVRDCGGLTETKNILRKFGELLCWWPAIIERTRHLAQQGITIGRPLN